MLSEDAERRENSDDVAKRMLRRESRRWSKVVREVVRRRAKVVRAAAGNGRNALAPIEEGIEEEVEEEDDKVEDKEREVDDD